MHRQHWTHAMRMLAMSRVDHMGFCTDCCWFDVSWVINLKANFGTTVWLRDTWKAEWRRKKTSQCQFNVIALKLDFGFSAWFDFNSVDVSLASTFCSCASIFFICTQNECFCRSSSHFGRFRCTTHHLFVLMTSCVWCF